MSVQCRASNSEIEFCNSSIEFQYRFRNSKLNNSVIFWMLKWASFAHKVDDFVLYRYLFSFLLFSTKING